MGGGKHGRAPRTSSARRMEGFAAVVKTEVESLGVHVKLRTGDVCNGRSGGVGRPISVSTSKPSLTGRNGPHTRSISTSKVHRPIRVNNLHWQRAGDYTETRYVVRSRKTRACPGKRRALANRLAAFPTSAAIRKRLHCLDNWDRRWLKRNRTEVRADQMRAKGEDNFAERFMDGHHNGQDSDNGSVASIHRRNTAFSAAGGSEAHNRRTAIHGVSGSRHRAPDSECQRHPGSIDSTTRNTRQAPAGRGFCVRRVSFPRKDCAHRPERHKMLIHECFSASGWIRFALSTSECGLTDQLDNRTTERRARHGMLPGIACGQFGPPSLEIHSGFG